MHKHLYEGQKYGPVCGLNVAAWKTLTTLKCNLYILVLENIDVAIDVVIINCEFPPKSM